MARLAPRRAALLADGALRGLHDHQQPRQVVEGKREGASPRVPAELPAEWSVAARRLEPEMERQERAVAIAVVWQVVLRGDLVSKGGMPQERSPLTPERKAMRQPAEVPAALLCEARAEALGGPQIAVTPSMPMVQQRVQMVLLGAAVTKQQGPMATSAAQIAILPVALALKQRPSSRRQAQPTRPLARIRPRATLPVQW